MSLNATPRGDRIHIALFGKRNAGKSSVINAMTNAGIAIDPNKEVVNMCEAIRQMVDEGIMLGEKRGEERGKKQGSMNEKLIIARRMLEKNYPMEQVVDLTMLTKQEVEELSRTIKQ